MKSFSKYKVILWDFDGVIMDSMPVRDKGFQMVLEEFDKAEVEKLMHFHRSNGGLSRYVKFRYFFEQIRKQEITEEVITYYSSRFSEIMRRELTRPQLLINDTMNFIKAQYRNFRMHIVSGSDQSELRSIAYELGIDHYFKSIHGSPSAKPDLITALLAKEQYVTGDVVFIGDSMNDYQAAQKCSLDFYGYNSNQLRGIGVAYINSFSPVNLSMHDSHV